MNPSPHMVKLLVIMLFCTWSIVKCTPDTTEVYKICSGRTYGLLDHYAVDECLVIEDLSNSTPTQGYNYYTSSNNCYGHGVCNGALTQPDCNACLGEAKVHVYEESGRSRSVRV